MTPLGRAGCSSSAADESRHRHTDAFPGELAARDRNVAAPHGDRGGTTARRSHSQQPGHGRVDPARQRGDRMAHYAGA